MPQSLPLKTDSRLFVCYACLSLSPIYASSCLEYVPSSSCTPCPVSNYIHALSVPARMYTFPQLFLNLCYQCSPNPDMTYLAVP